MNAARGPDAEEGRPDSALLESVAHQAPDRNHGTARKLVREASTADLAVAVVVPVAEIEVFTLGELVPCPRCQPSSLDLMLHAPAGLAQLTGIECALCGKVTTRWRIERMVLEDADALDRLAASSRLVTAVTA